MPASLLPLLEARRGRNKIPVFSCPILHPFCQAHCVILEYSFGHPQPPPTIFAVSHVRGNYPNRQTGKVNFAAPQKFALERAKKILWIGTQLFLAPEHE
ncbi:hypothetical protein M441DRAFT_66124 [Trichoderma asperellum CBS 433.97]|uniref:Uncharacterized protein n=1 Tax=Trichoderma asperellum (strain ATCC 204424 / CBS 433.97 / NBRC 101777) TaxID=1042311 RepID=A0A2T3ZHT9_TRIA4|nr:hypothetical protein M441DRAFT_66124 [Trichoderma asperellum CBS 433.97]PTB44362.1 hypothetical protein M441DRAFT_66124 [Trichoderma asperellum CBS 433.97]